MQQHLPIDVAPDEIARKQSLGAAIELCAELAGYCHKRIQAELHFDKGQWSRWVAGQEGVAWPKLEALMSHCGNSAPVLWQLHRCGYDLHSLRRVESELERQNRLLQEENAALRRVLMGGR